MMKDINIRLSRRTVLQGASVVGLIGFPNILKGATRELVIGGAASHKLWMDQHIIPAFEKAHGVKITFEGTKSTVNRQKMESNKDNPYLSVVMMDVPEMIPAIEAGLLAPLDPAAVKNLADLREGDKDKSLFWASYLNPWGGIAFNPGKVAGVQSWLDLWDPKYKGRVAIPSLQNSDGVFQLYMAAHLATGKPLAEAQYDPDAAFSKLQELKPNLLTIFTNIPQTSNLLEQGEAHLMTTFSSWALLRKSTGAPINLAAPKEGIFALPSGIALVKGGPNGDLAAAFINEMLGAEYQNLITPTTYSLPTNKLATIPDGMPSASAIFSPDWANYIKHRPAWIEKWDKVMSL
jgi:putative spermidine/putrescine transport system substrate-binding protein